MTTHSQKEPEKEQPQTGAPPVAETAQPQNVPDAQPVVATEPVPPGVSEVDTLKAELEQAKADVEQHKNSMLRAAADYQNYRKQHEKDREAWVSFANIDLFGKIIPFIDDFDKVIEHVDEEARKSKWFEGLLLTYKKLEKVLEEAGLKEIAALNLKFDPRLHQAVMEEAVEGKSSGTVITVLQRGFELNGRVVRASMVKIAK